MKAKVTQALEQFDQMPVRTRLLITFSVIVILGLLIDLFFISDSQKKAEDKQRAIAQNQMTLNELINNQQQLNATFLNQRNHPVKQEIVQLDKQIAQLQKQLKSKTANLIQPESMAGVLREIILHSENLQLIGLTKQAPVALFDQQDEDAALAQNTTLANQVDTAENSNENSKTEVKMYRHLVKIELEGDYQATQMFLQKLENMPQKVKFESLDYLVDEYPKATISLVVSTLSFNKKWIGG